MSESSPASSERPDVQERSVESLDWYRILEALAERASTAMGQEICVDLPFFDNVVAARAALVEVREWMTLITAGRAPSLGGIADVRMLLDAAQKGEILNGSELIAFAHTLEGLTRLHRQLGDCHDVAPRLLHVSHRIHPQPDLAAWLIRSFDPRGELSVATYPQLSNLRSRKARLHASIRDTLDRLRGDDRYGSALQDDFTAMRNDRYVVPVKASAKRSGLGIVHDASGSRQTVFVEPFEVVDLNNDLKMADAELLAEERRILRDLSERVAMSAGDCRRSLTAATHLDVVAAKGQLGVDLGASVVTVPDEPIIKLTTARHPILVLRGLDVIANDVSLGGSKPALVLSGPNTGGKTVTLKTLGLAALLVRAGMAVPADATSQVGFFDRVLTDIGDQQDVEGDLSTFSGHVLCLCEIFESLRSGGAGALVLIDEIAVGTDPVQGAALGRALLLSLLEGGALLATTTHYPELKALAATDERFTSGRVEFDAEEGRPTYRLAIGKPGSSHALDVAARVGLPEAILTMAHSFLDPTTKGVEDLLAGLEAELGVARDAKAAAEADRAAAAEQLEAVHREREELKKRLRDAEKEVRADFEKEVRGYRVAVRGAMHKIKAERSDRAVERARQKITDGAAEVRDAVGDVAPLPPSAGGLDLDALKVGDEVRVATIGKNAKVVSVPDKRGRLQVNVGGMMVQVKASDLLPARVPHKPEKASKKSKKPSKPPRSATASTEEVASGDPSTAFRTPDNTLDLRGERLEEALERTEQFLDELSLRQRAFAFILHGHGTGVLKSAIRKQLKSSHYVAQWDRGTRSQGGDGITVVKLK